MYSGPARGGTRGGQDQFKWEDVKSDKYRENYLGHSVKAPLGRWQKGRDLTWYAKEKKAGLSGHLSERERQMLEVVRQQEQEMLLEQIGAIPRKKRQAPEGVDAVKMKEILARGQIERDEKFDVERVSGLGCGTSFHHTKIGPAEQVIASNWTGDDAAFEQSGSVPATSSGLTGEQQRKLEKRAAKEERKREKRLKKEERRKRHDSPSPSRGRRRHDSPDRGRELGKRRRHDSVERGRRRDRSRSPRRR
ncbi:Multiple myeloma tumor-associated protein 2-like N-terminal domain-containing protein [Plasmodiophora brassicae]|uniref:Multiple myeloma tumor-associated protein 2-like N-terminal domain-containing protein n=2 Tax=Plasmodiophora brassicae TaxID=37360 RepID=A0A3P3YC85_PLABS|nr:unnamed protein product [Plasmodiophora brassicae]